MSQLVVWNLLLIVTSAAICAYVMTWLARTVAPKMDLVDRPDGTRKLHEGATPLMGGVAVFGAMTATLLACRFLGDHWHADGSQPISHIVALIASAGCFCVIGLWDDRWAMRARTKFCWQIVASFPFACWGPSIDTIQFLGVEVQLGVFGSMFVVFWLVSCANIVNLLDGLDGLAGTIGLIATLTMAILSLMIGNESMAVLSLIVAGSIAGFLIHNLPPARIFLGDAGSLTIGFLVGALAIKTSQKTVTCFTLVGPLVVLAVPVFDTMMAILRRKLAGKSIGEADRGHIHHCLQDQGLSGKQTLLTIALLCCSMAATTVVAALCQSDLVAVLLCGAILVVMIVGRVFGYREFATLARYCHAALAMLVEAISVWRTNWRMVHQAELSTEGRSTDWDALRRTATQVGGVHLRLSYDDSDTRNAAMEWTSDDDSASDEPIWSVEFSTLRDDNRRVNVMATGYADEPQQDQLDDLIQVVQSICQGLPISAPNDERVTDPALRDEDDTEILSIDSFRTGTTNARRAA